jgi:transposase
VLRISDEHWELIRKHFPEEHYPDDRPGRKPIPARKVLEAVLWILNTGAQWHMLPQSYPNYKTVHRRFQQWCQDEVIRAALTDLANTLREQGEVDESECYIDATFASAKGGGEQIGPTRRGKGVKIMAIVDRHGLPLAVTTHAANHHEVTLVQLTFDFYMIESAVSAICLAASPASLYSIHRKAWDRGPIARSWRRRPYRLESRLALAGSGKRTCREP